MVEPLVGWWVKLSTSISVSSGDINQVVQDSTQSEEGIQLGEPSCKAMIALGLTFETYGIIPSWVILTAKWYTGSLPISKGKLQ